MSKFLWKGLLVSPAVLAASLVVSTTALAAEQPIERFVSASSVNISLTEGLLTQYPAINRVST